MERKLSIWQHKIILLVALFCLPGILCGVEASIAAGSGPGATVGQIEATVIHVDQYAVFAPNLVFYFDTQTDKKKIASLMRTANHLRNKKALITYSATGELGRDRHVLLVDIAPAGEKPRAESPPREASVPAGDIREKPVDILPGKEAAPPGPARPVEPQGPSKQAAVQEKKPLQTGEQSTPITREKKPPQTAAIPVEPQAPSKQAVVQEQKPPPAAAPVELREPSRQAAVREQKPPLATEQSGSITREEITAFVRRMLELNSRKDLAAIAPLYADKVDYYDRGVVNRDYVRKDLGYYFRNWDQISTSVDGDVVMIVLDQPGVRIAKFITSYAVRNDKKSVAGKTENIWKIQKIDGQLRLFDVKQKIISNKAPGL
ncbi:MAG: hypothetical protein WAW37_04770 [Syntrophobacteraceae bacterium]